MKWLFLFLILMVFAQLQAQEKDSLDWDIDSVFNDPVPESPPEKPKTDTAKVTATAINKLKKMQSFNFDASYEFTTGIMPGWVEYPWSSADDPGYFLDRLIKLRSSLGMDAQIDNTFRVRSKVYFEIPNFSFKLGDFFFDYNLYDAVFFRGGKYAYSWGISPNYDFTNLLIRLPKDAYAGESFIFKIDVPTGIGGFQALALTRANLMGNMTLPKLEDFGYGGKYNLALRGADINLGIYYQDGMAMRTFLSIKTSFGKTDLYSEGLIATDGNESPNVSGAVSFGFTRDFLTNKFNVNGEVFYNNEKDVYRYRPETNIREAGKDSFVEGLNFALNLRYKFDGKSDSRLLARIRYTPFENSAQFIPAFRFKPWPHIELYTAMPMSLGSKEGYYYKNPYIVDTQKRPIPFGFLLMISIKGSIQFGYTR